MLPTLLGFSLRKNGQAREGTHEVIQYADFMALKPAQSLQPPRERLFRLSISVSLIWEREPDGRWRITGMMGSIA